MLAWISNRVFMGAAQRRLFERGTPVLTYHKIGEPAAGTRDPFLYTRAASFDAQLASLSRAGYRTIGLGELSVSKASGKAIVLTFDDGFASALEQGLPILARHNARAIQFIVAGMIGKRNEWDITKGDVAEPLMDAAQIKEWLGAGNEIGSHSMTHRNLKKLSEREAREEIFGSRKFLEDKFGVVVNHFCYPFGGFTPAVRDLVIEAGYTTASTVMFGVNSAGCDLFSLRRIIPYDRSELRRKILHRLLRRFDSSKA